MPFAPSAWWRLAGFRFPDQGGTDKYVDDARILTFRYTEPMTWWMALRGGPRTLSAA